VGVGSDVSKRKRSEERGARREERVQTCLEAFATAARMRKKAGKT